MTAPATLPRPMQANAGHGATRAAASVTQRHGSTADQTGFAQLLRSQDDEALRAADPATASATPAVGSDTDARQASRPAERDRERQPGSEDASAAAQATLPQPQAETPRPELPGNWVPAALGGTGTPGGTTRPAEDDGCAETSFPLATQRETQTAVSDPLAALRDAMGHGLTAPRRHGPATDRQAERAANDGTANDGAKAGATGFALALDAAGDSATNTTPAAPLAAAVAEPVAIDGALPSLGAVTDPARPLHAAAPAAEATPTAHASLPATPGTPAFGPALGLQLSTWLKDGVQHASLELHPQDLGPIDVRIAVKDGQTRIALAADVASTRQALVEAMPQLSAALGEVGLSLSGGSVADPSAQGRQGEGASAEAGRSTGRASARMAAGVDGPDTTSRAPATARQHRGLLDLYA